jgi:hypothetical protein
MTSATDEPQDPAPQGTPDPHESDAMAGPHGADDHGDGHGHDDPAHDDGDALGSVDLRAWGAGVLGIVGGLIVAAVLAVGAGWLG